MIASIENATRYFAAVQLTPARYAFPVEIGKPLWRTCDGTTLVLLYELHLAHVNHNRAQHVFEKRTIAMPPWWNPDTRCAYRLKTTHDVVPTLEAAARFFEPGAFRRKYVERITADLNTGKEILAA